MRRRALLPSAFFVALILGAARAAVFAADAPGLADRWKAATSIPRAMRKVMVVGITPDALARRKFEDHFITQLRAHDVEAITSYSIVPDLKAERDRTAVLGALFAQRVEGLITVRLAPLDDTPEEARAPAWRAAMERPDKPRDYVEAALRGFDAEASEFGAEVAYWSVDDARRVWAGRFPGESMKFLRKHAPEMVQAVIDEMVFQGLF